jgi:LysR family transcriptional regulator, glycine cleavage system transcriptional activator
VAARAGARNVPPARGPLFSLFSLALQTAIDGVGVLIGRRTLVQEALADGRVICPFDLSLPATDRLTLLLPTERDLPSRQRELVEWFRREAP